MANTEYTHAGNSGQLTEIQLDKMPRCVLCHFKVGAEIAGQVIELTPIRVTLAADGERYLVCQLCIKLIRQAGDMPTAIANKRQLPAALQAVNDEAMRLLELHEATATDNARYFMGTGKVYIVNRETGEVVGKGMTVTNFELTINPPAAEIPAEVENG